MCLEVERASMIHNIVQAIVTIIIYNYLTLLLDNWSMISLVFISYCVFDIAILLFFPAFYQWHYHEAFKVTNNATRSYWYIGIVLLAFNVVAAIAITTIHEVLIYFQPEHISLTIISFLLTGWLGQVTQKPASA